MAFCACLKKPVRAGGGAGDYGRPFGAEQNAPPPEQSSLPKGESDGALCSAWGGRVLLSKVVGLSRDPHR